MSFSVVGLWYRYRGLENFDFLVGQPILTSLRADPAGQNGLSCNNEVSIHDHKILKNFHKMKSISFSDRYTSKLPVGGYTSKLPVVEG